MPIVVCAEGPDLARVLDAAYSDSHQGLSRRAFTAADAALRTTAWAADHQRRYALVDGDEVLASAQRYELSGTFARQALRICGIGGVCSNPIHGHADHARAVIRGWLPPGFVPPQVTIVSTQPSVETLLARPLTSTVDRLGLSSDDVLYWRSDVF